MSGRTPQGSGGFLNTTQAKDFRRDVLDSREKERRVASCPVGQSLASGWEQQAQGFTVGLNGPVPRRGVEGRRPDRVLLGRGAVQVRTTSLWRDGSSGAAPGAGGRPGDVAGVGAGSAPVRGDAGRPDRAAGALPGHRPPGRVRLPRDSPVRGARADGAGRPFRPRARRGHRPRAQLRPG
ncbi:carbohydrate porin [Corallococcus macrosporus]|uniref:carbohydrate porin n=1 Tax=Corallococcus macrosporus TaxID=35 RepID=UPI0012FE1A28